MGSFADLLLSIFQCNLHQAPINSFCELLGNLRRNQTVSKLKNKEMSYCSFSQSYGAAAAAAMGYFADLLLSIFQCNLHQAPINSFYDLLGNLRRNQTVSKLKKKEMSNCSFSLSYVTRSL